jgi:hypothetical protein
MLPTAAVTNEDQMADKQNDGDDEQPDQSVDGEADDAKNDVDDQGGEKEGQHAPSSWWMTGRESTGDQLYAAAQDPETVPIRWVRTKPNVTGLPIAK